MNIKLEAARALVHHAAASAGDGFPDIAAAARAKILAAETAIEVTNDALQIFGSAGYSRNRPLERMVRDARMFYHWRRHRADSSHRSRLTAARAKAAATQRTVTCEPPALLWTGPGYNNLSFQQSPNEDF